MRRRRPSLTTGLALAGVFVALGGAAGAAQLIDGGTIAKNSLPGNRVKNGTLSAAALKPQTLTGKQINLAKLGTVPRAALADQTSNAAHAASADKATKATSADSASTAASATHATSADSASTAASATHATSADSATRATTADTASALPARGAYTKLTLAPGWTDTYPTTEGSPVGFYVDHEGFVHLRGGVTGTNSSPAVIATLPVGARPVGAANTGVAFAVPTYLGKVEQVLISGDGTISFIGSAYGFVGLDGITFPAA